MTKNSTIKVLGGTIAGVAMGFAAATFLRSKQGKAFKKNTKEMLADFYDSIAPEIKKVKKFTRKEYNIFIEKAAEHYGNAKKISKEKVHALITEAKKSWKEFSQQFEKN